MAQGLRVWDENGNITVDTDYRMSRKLGTLYINWIGGGSFNVPEFSTGKAWIMPVVDWMTVVKEDDPSKGNVYPTPTLNGTTITWTWGPRLDGKGRFYASWIIYGVY